MPVRTVSNRGRRNVIGYFPSLKMRRMVQFESTLERDLIYLLDFDRRVTAFEEQPLKLAYQHERKSLSYTPDFRAEFASGQRMLLECKPCRFVNSEENQRKFSAAQAWCATHSWHFRIVTEEQLRAGCRVHNVKLLTQHARHEVAVPLKGSIFAFLAGARQPVTIGDVLVGVNPANPSAVVMPILHMAYHHELYLPLDEAPLSAQSTICASCTAGEEGDTDEYDTLFNG